MYTDINYIYTHICICVYIYICIIRVTSCYVPLLHPQWKFEKINHQWTIAAMPLGAWYKATPMVETTSLPWLHSNQCWLAGFGWRVLGSDCLVGWLIGWLVGCLYKPFGYLCRFLPVDSS